MLKRFINRLFAAIVKYLPLIVDLASKIAIAFVFLIALNKLSDQLERLHPEITALFNHEDQYNLILQQHDADVRAIADLNTRISAVEKAASDAETALLEIRKASKAHLR